MTVIHTTVFPLFRHANDRTSSQTSCDVPVFVSLSGCPLTSPRRHERHCVACEEVQFHLCTPPSSKPDFGPIPLPSWFRCQFLHVLASLCMSPQSATSLCSRMSAFTRSMFQMFDLASFYLNTVNCSSREFSLNSKVANTSSK